MGGTEFLGLGQKACYLFKTSDFYLTEGILQCFWLQIYPSGRACGWPSLLRNGQGSKEWKTSSPTGSPLEHRYHMCHRHSFSPQAEAAILPGATLGIRTKKQSKPRPSCRRLLKQWIHIPPGAWIMSQLYNIHRPTLHYYGRFKGKAWVLPICSSIFKTILLAILTIVLWQMRKPKHGNIV